MGSLTEGREDNQINFTVQNQGRTLQAEARVSKATTHFLCVSVVCDSTISAILLAACMADCYYSPHKESGNNRIIRKLKEYML